MIGSSCKFENMGSRESFNASVRHVKATISFAETLGDGVNLADALNKLVDSKQVTSDEVLPFVSMLLVDKYSYVSACRNLTTVATDIDALFAEAAGWKAVDLVVVYHHPDMGVLAFNPKNPTHRTLVDRLNRFEFATVYAGGFDKPVDATLAAKAAETMLDLMSGTAAKVDPALLKGPFAYKAPAAPKAEAPAARRGPKAPKAAPRKPGRPSKAAPQAAAPVAQAAPAAPEPAAKAAPALKPGARMTPMYAVNVTNELFHNGNVEAWKRIIASYRIKHPDLEVLVYYDGERITNLNALFKWGKVKHGNVIQFAVAGEAISEVAKLQRYLAQGASNMYEAFLRGPVNGVLPLF